MTSYSNLKCWEIINCINLGCPARNEPETPCWEIAERTGAYRDSSKTCRDCIVYLLHNEAPVLSKKEVLEILKHSGIRTGYSTCTLKISING